MKRRHETPQRRRYTDGKVVWVARYTDPKGRRRIYKPGWNNHSGTFDLKRDAQAAIDEAYEQMARPGTPDTLGVYAETWTTRHPRSERTNDTNDHRVGRVLDVQIAGRELRDTPLRDLRRRHANELVDHLLRVQGRSVLGARNILRALSALMEDAIDDEIADANPFRGVKIRANDPRARKQPRKVRVFTFEQMHAFAAAAGPCEAMVRTLADCGLRLGELLPLERADLDGAMLHVRRTSHEGRVLAGTKTDHGDPDAGRVCPVPPSLLVMLQALPVRIDTPLLFPTLTGKVWAERNFYRDVWYPTQHSFDECECGQLRSVHVEGGACAFKLAKRGVDIRPHEMRHSYVSLLNAAGIDQADVAKAAGHTVQTMNARYRHALGRSFDAMREAIG